MNLFNKFNCNSIEFVGKSELKKKNTTNIADIINNKQTDIKN